MKKIAVIGSNSFTGSHFVDYALKNTDAEIIGISRSPEYNHIFLPYKYKKSATHDRFVFFNASRSEMFNNVWIVFFFFNRD